MADWVRAAKARGLAGAGQELVAGWATLGPREVAAWAAERTCCRPHAPRMRDDQDQAAGSPLGTGAVERQSPRDRGTGQAGRDALAAARAALGLGAACAAPVPPLGRLVESPSPSHPFGRVIIPTHTPR